MKPLEKLIIEAQIITEPEAEVERVVQVYNACRYCEGFCTIPPVMTQCLALDKVDINYLANLRHNCGARLHVRQYAPPYGFAINMSKAMAEVRLETYQRYAQPAASGSLYRRVGVTTILALAGGLISFLLPAMGLKGSLLHSPLAGDLCQISPHSLLAQTFGSAPVLTSGLLMTGVIRFWYEIPPGQPHVVDVAKASQDALTLKYLDGGHSKSCNEAGDALIPLCCRLHHFTFCGLMLCLTTTVVATGYHYFTGQEAPYPFFNFLTLLGTLGGTSLLVGSADLLWLNLHRSPLHGDARQKSMDRDFIPPLLLTSFTGLVLLAGRDTSWVGILLAVHLGVVMVLLLVLPYGKFAHGFYRCMTLPE